MPGATLNPVGFQQANSAFLNGTAESQGPGFYSFGQDAYWGGREFIYAKAGGTIPQFGLCVITPSVVSAKYVYTATAAPNTANLGRPLGVAMVGAASGDFLWLCVGGIVPVNCAASVAAGTAFGIVAAGQGGAIANGKQVLNACVVVAATATVAKTGCTGAAGALVIQVPNSEGWFIGGFLSGTGITAGTTIASIDPSGRFVTLSAVTTSAYVGGTMTVTYNDATTYYNVAHINRPFAQGQVT